MSMSRLNFEMWSPRLTKIWKNLQKFRVSPFTMEATIQGRRWKLCRLSSAFLPRILTKQFNLCLRLTMITFRIPRCWRHRPIFLNRDFVAFLRACECIRIPCQFRLGFHRLLFIRPSLLPNLWSVLNDRLLCRDANFMTICVLQKQCKTSRCRGPIAKPKGRRLTIHSVKKPCGLWIPQKMCTAGKRWDRVNLKKTYK